MSWISRWDHLALKSPVLHSLHERHLVVMTRSGLVVFAYQAVLRLNFSYFCISPSHAWRFLLGLCFRRGFLAELFEHVCGRRLLGLTVFLKLFLWISIVNCLKRDAYYVRIIRVLQLLFIFIINAQACWDNWRHNLSVVVPWHQLCGLNERWLFFVQTQLRQTLSVFKAWLWHLWNLARWRHFVFSRNRW